MFEYDHQKKLNASRKAFTLVEIMIAILLTTIVLTAIFMIWSRVRLGISRSHTKQMLQNELRKAANYIQNDFKSIKYAEEGEKDALTYSSSDTGFSMQFTKFKENTDESQKKLSQDSTESVSYVLANNVLKRDGDKTTILSAHCESVSLERTEDEDKSDEKFTDARNAKLNIEITGKMKVPGTNEEMYHVEKTSVVMRNEYYKMINKNYKSNFDLQEMKDTDIVKKGEELTADDYDSMPDDVLEDLKTNQDTIIQQCKDNLDNINTQIAGEEPEGVPWYEKLWSWIGGSNLYGDFKDEQEALEKAETKEEVEAAVKEIQDKADEQEETFLKNSYEGYENLSDDEKKEVKRVYDMAVHDKAVMDAYNEAKNSEGSDGNETPPITNERMLKLQSQGKTIVTDKDGNETEVDLKTDQVTNEAVNAKIEEANKFLDIYDKISLDWMTDGTVSEEEVNIYKSRKNLLEAANTKMELINVRDEAEENKAEIQKVLDSRK